MCNIFYNLYKIKHFGKFPFMSWMNYSSLSRLYINSWKKYSSFIQMDETWENGQFKKKINIHLTARLNQLEVLWSYWQSDISRPPSFWKSMYLSLEMSERNISLRVYLKMMYFLSVNLGMGGSSVCVEGGVIWLGVLRLRQFIVHLRQFYVCANKFYEFYVSNAPKINSYVCANLP